MPENEQKPYLLVVCDPPLDEIVAEEAEAARFEPHNLRTLWEQEPIGESPYNERFICNVVERTSYDVLVFSELHGALILAAKRAAREANPECRVLGLRTALYGGIAGAEDTIILSVNPTRRYAQLKKAFDRMIAGLPEYSVPIQ